MAATPETRFTRAGTVDIAYQVVGDAPLDVVLVPGWISHCELAWELPESARFLTRFTEFSRVILFDKRGTGLSDRTVGSPTLEERMEDVGAVLDAVGIESAALVGWADGAAMALTFAATYPQRVTAMALGAVVGRVQGGSDGEPWAPDAAAMDFLAETIESHWGEGLSLSFLAPSAALDPRVLAWWRRYERSSATPNAAAAMYRSMMEIDVRPILPVVQAPTLIVHRRDVQVFPGSAARWVADTLPAGKFVELPGIDLLPYLGDADSVVDTVAEFLTGAPSHDPVDRVLATVLFTDIVGSTEKADALGDRAWRDLLDAHHAEVRRLIARFGGREIDTAGDGFLITFDGPARAIRAAVAIREAVGALGLTIRAGLHTGEVELRGGSISGIAVHIGARVAAQAEPGAVFVTSTVKDLVIGSGVRFEDAGSFELKGVPGEWRLYRVEGG